MSNESFKVEILAEIERRIKGFYEDPTHMESYIKDSRSVVVEYNGRQIFEMLQNIDDQMFAADLPDSERACQIELNLKTRSLYFRNKGEPFSVRGIKSIMYPHASSKDNRTIGNKGLGFRSLLNWSPSKIIIRSAGLSFTFSRDTVRDCVSKSEKLKSHAEVDKLPVLTFPQVDDWGGNKDGWVTEIELCGVDYERQIGNPVKSIMDELNEFNPELMLFLPNLRHVEITITGDGVSKRTQYGTSQWVPMPGCAVKLPAASVDERMIRKLVDGQKIFETRWIAYRGRGDFKGQIPVEDGESSLYNYAIAVPYEVSKQHLFETLYDYLPLRHVDLKLPCLVHATVKLDGRRDVLVVHEANNLLFSTVLPAAFNDFAEILKSSEIVKDRWLAYRLLTPLSFQSNGYVGALYQKLRNIRLKGEFYPCVDGRYRSAEKVCYYKTQDNEATQYFNQHPDMVPSYLLGEEPPDIMQHACSAEYLVASINKVLQTEDGNVKLSDAELAELAYILWQINKIQGTQFYEKGNARLPGVWLFHDKDGKVLDSRSKNVYTPAAGEGLTFPGYMKADFICDALWKSLCERFRLVIDSVDEDNKVRYFCNHELGRIVDFEYYDRYAAAKKMIQSSDVELRRLEDVSQKRDVVHQLLHALWMNFREDNEPGRQKERVPLFVEETGHIQYADEFMFESAAKYYGNNLTQAAFLSDDRISELFHGLEIDVPRRFLCYLGVRADVRVSTEVIDCNNGYYHFLETIGEDHKGLPPRSKCSMPFSGKREVKSLKDAKVLRELSTADLLRLLENSEVDGFAAVLKGRDEERTIDWKGENKRYSQKYTVEWSYAAYQLKDTLRNVIFDENDKVLSSLGWKNGQLTKRIPADVLYRLGAKGKLSDLSTNELYDLLKVVAEKDLPLTKDFYKKINAAFVIHKKAGEVFSPPDDLLLYGISSGGRGYFNAKEISYHDNPSHARVLAKDCKMLFMGSRVGADNVSEFFGVQKLDDSKVEIKSKEPIAKETQAWFDADYRQKAHCLSALLCRRRDVSSVVAMEMIMGGHVQLVSSLSYSYGGGETRQLERFEYLKDKDNAGYYYLALGEVGDVYGLSRNESKAFCRAMAAVLCDIVDSSSDVLESEFYECYYDFEGKYAELVDGNYLTEGIEAPEPTPNFYIGHVQKMRNAFDTVFVTHVKPLLWIWLNNQKDLQQYYRAYQEAFRSQFAEAMQDGGVLEKICFESKDKEQEQAFFKEEILKFLKGLVWSGSLNQPALGWDNVVQDWKEPDTNKYSSVRDRIEKTDDPEKISLLYFDGNENVLHAFVELEKKADVASPEAKEVRDEDLELLNVSIAHSGFVKPKTKDYKLSDVSLGKAGTGKAMTRKKSESMEAHGDLAERYVEKWLCSIPDFSCVTRVSGTSRSSGKSDRLHYDISYIKDGKTYYVEVKACDSGEFFISDGELEFARKSPETYRLALVYIKSKEVEMIDHVYSKLKGDDVKTPESWRVSLSRN